MGERNDALAALIQEAGYSEAGLARRVNQLARDRLNLDLRYDYTAVYRWKKGQQPRPPVPWLLAEALSERLGRRVAAAEFGMLDEGVLADQGLAYPADPLVAVETILELGKAGMKRRTVITNAPFVVAALAGPSRDWLLAVLEQQRGGWGPRAVGLAQVEAIRTVFRFFQELDVMRGGGHGRAALVQYLDSEVLPLLREACPEPVRRALLEVAAEQSYLVGWMAYDDGRHGLAQRYLVQALKLAEGSGNVALGAHVLARLSELANQHGHPREALQLARTGQQALTTTSTSSSPACLADLHILEARALAALGEAAAAAKAVATAEAVFERVVREREPEWARFIDAAYLFGQAAWCFGELGRAREAEVFASASLADAERQGRARRGTLSYGARAVAALQRGEVEAAAGDAMRALELAGQVASKRARRTVQGLCRRFQACGPGGPAGEFLERARAALGTAA